MAISVNKIEGGREKKRVEDIKNCEIIYIRPAKEPNYNPGFWAHIWIMLATVRDMKNVLT